MKHVPVMLQESLEIYKNRKIHTFLDGTLGAAGFAKAFLMEHPEVKTYYAFDRDSDALNIAKKNLEEFEEKVTYIHSNFSHLKNVLHQQGVNSVDGFFLTWECHPCS